MTINLPQYRRSLDNTLAAFDNQNTVSGRRVELLKYFYRNHVENSRSLGAQYKQLLRDRLLLVESRWYRANPIHF